MGVKLIADTVHVSEEVRSYYAEKIGKQELKELESNLRTAARKLELDFLPPFWADPQDS